MTCRTATGREKRPPRGGIAEYAYGYTDRKPWGAVIIAAIMFAVVVIGPFDAFGQATWKGCNGPTPIFEGVPDRDMKLRLEQACVNAYRRDQRQHAENHERTSNVKLALLAVIGATIFGGFFLVGRRKRRGGAA